MSALALVITKAGMDRFTAAQLGADIDLTVSSVGLTAQSFVAAPTLTTVPGEFRRVATVSGEAVGDHIVHMVVRDEADIRYEVRGFGLYLDDGTLFATYAQEQLVVEKSPATTLYLAIDVAFPTADVKTLVFGSTDFLNPPATTERAGVVKIATQPEAEAGTPGPLTITAALLKALLDPLRAGAFASRKIEAAGLVTGGGDLSADRTFTVTAATAAEVDAATSTTKAVTPAGLVNVLASILARVPLTRRVDTSGLALGGGELGTDITISVPAATGAQLRAGGATDAAATPAALAEAGAVYVVQQLLQQNGGYRVWSDGLKECWGQIGVGANATANVQLPVAHSAWIAPAGAPGAIAQDEQMLGILNVGLGGFDVRNRNPMAATFYWHSKGV